jgi:Ca2+-binding RTX toxin-like protein
MTVRTVGRQADFASIADAMIAAGPGDLIDLQAGYSDETAFVTRSGLTLDAERSSTGIVLTLQAGVTAFSLTGDGSVDVFDFTDGNAIVGNAGGNVITVRDGADSVDGGLGVDRLVVDYRLATGAITGTLSSVAEAGGSRLVTIAGGTIEHLTILTGSGADTITTGDGDDVIHTGEGAGTVTAGQGFNRVTGGSGADTITVLDGGNVVQAGDGDNTVTSGAGVDQIVTGRGADTVSAGAGDDLITLNGGSDTIHGEAGVDRLVVNYGASLTKVTMLAPTGTLAGHTGRVADGGANTASFDGIEHFSITGGSAGDSVTTGAGDDVLNGSAGNDMLSGGAGNDRLIGGDGDDVLFGGLGDDVFVGGTGADRLGGGQGVDTATYYTAGAAVSVSLAVTVAQDTAGAGIDTLTGVDNLTGSIHGDVLTGNAGANVLNGFDGDDRLQGGDGADRLIGGLGADTFVFTAVSDSDGAALDRITDLQASDVIDLSGIDANGAAAGDGVFSRIGNSAVFDMPGQMRLSQHGATTWLELNTDGDVAAEATILLNGFHTSASAADGWVL